MKLMPVVAIALLCSLSGAAHTQSSAPPASEGVENGVPISKLIAVVARKTGKKFVVDPKVRGEVALIGQDPSSITYNELLTVLHVYGFTASEYGGYVTVIPDAGVRSTPVPVLSGKETRPEAQFVSKIITVHTVPAAQLVPLLRPIIPQSGHLVALPCVNKLMLVDTYGNVRRIETLIESMDTGEPFKPEKCEMHGAP